jgi:beta-lactamase regulating signal transducer with metallopeptidase domain
MGLGTSLFLIAAGAVLRWAVNVTNSNVNLHTIGLILLIVGGIGFLISLFWMTVWADRTAARTPAERAPRADEPAYRDRYRDVSPR